MLNDFVTIPPAPFWATIFMELAVVPSIPAAKNSGLDSFIPSISVSNIIFNPSNFFINIISVF